MKGDHNAAGHSPPGPLLPRPRRGGVAPIAIDQHTGAEMWKPQSAPRGTTDAPAVYYDGLVYMGVGGGEGGVRGQFGAYAAKTGKEVWKFYTVPGPGEPGSETWEG